MMLDHLGHGNAAAAIVRAIETVLADDAVRRNEMSLEGQAALLVKFDLERKIGARHLEIVEQRRVPDMRDHLSDIEA